MSDTLLAMKQEFLRRCLTLDLEPTVLGDGRIDAEIIIIGEGPGSQEVLAKRPMVGPTGQLLWNTLRPHGILRTDVYVTNVCKRQMSLDKRKSDDIGADEWLKWQNLLQWEIAQFPNAKYIFALGNAALGALHGLHGITSYRGSVYEYTAEEGREPLQVLYSFNPAAVLRSPEDEIIFQFDARRFKEVIHNDYQPWPVTTTYDFTFDEAMGIIGSYKSALLPTAVDIELTSGQLACVGLARDEHVAHCINFRGQLENIYTQDEEIKLLFALQDLYETLASADCLIAQNGAFDSGFSSIIDNMNMPISYDTMLMHHTLYPTLPHNLGFLTSMYTTIPYYKGEFDDFKETGEVNTLWEYNGKDCCATLASWTKMKRELQSQGLWDFYCSHVKRLQPHCLTSTRHGVPVDLEMKQKVTEQLREDETKALEHFQYVVQQALNFPEGNSYRPNPGSWQQLKKLFYDPGYLGLKHRTQGTDADARKQLMADPRTSAEAKEVLVAINKWKEISKFRSTYAEMRLDKDNRFRTVWNQQGVQSAPGRLSSSQTLWGTGMNVQNQPPAARKFFIADPGCVFFYFDLSQAEARVVAYRADIDKWKEDFERARIDGSYDAHRALASEMFKVPYDDVPKSDRNDDDTDYTIRYIAKRCRHGLNYRMHIDRLAETTGLSYARAAASYHAYHKINPEIQKWWAQQELLIKRERQMFNALGRRWKVLQRIDDDALIPIVAFYPQSTIGDKVCQVWYQSQEDDRWDTSKARIVFNIHDALIGMATKEYAKTALSICKAYAEKPMMIQNVYGTKTEQLIVPADTAISSLEQRDKKGTVISIDKYHRWSGLVKEKIEAASLAA